MSPVVEMLSGVDSNDHIHLLVSAPPTLSISDIMRRIKGRSSSNSVSY
ncbi:MAG: hypothetical protein COA42_16820 [Alteromonadaceae bacterium]|nr:MAG: hypothetical protein COA42_16820 [Alteromonadaceae bacterium]